MDVDGAAAPRARPTFLYQRESLMRTGLGLKEERPSSRASERPKQDFHTQDLWQKPEFAEVQLCAKSKITTAY